MHVGHSAVNELLLFWIVSCAECYSETRVTENSEGVLYYPGFDQYGNNVRCEWTYTAPEGYVCAMHYGQLISCVFAESRLAMPLCPTYYFFFGLEHKI